MSEKRGGDLDGYRHTPTLRQVPRHDCERFIRNIENMIKTFYGNIFTTK
jgi:hypothetical protein